MPASNQATGAQLVQANVEDADRAEEQHGGLEHGGVHDHAQATQGRVDPGGHGKTDGNHPEEWNLVSEHGHAVSAQQHGEDHVRGIEGRGDLGEHQAGDGEEAQDGARSGRKAPFQELRHGEDLDAVVDGYEDPPQDQDDPCLNFPVCHGHARREARAGQAHEMLGTDVGGVDRGADLQPSRLASGKKIVGARLGLLARGGPHHHHHTEKEQNDYKPVQAVEHRARVQRPHRRWVHVGTPMRLDTAVSWRLLQDHYLYATSFQRSSFLNSRSLVSLSISTNSMFAMEQ